jgi:hypothetical protein
MSACVEDAMRETNFGLVRSEDGSSAVNLFMVNEAEAAATHALASHMRLGTLKV